MNSNFATVFDTRLQAVVGTCLGVFLCVSAEKIVALHKSKSSKSLVIQQCIVLQTCWRSREIMDFLI